MTADATALIGSPYTPPRGLVGSRLYDALRQRQRTVTALHDTSFGPWLAVGRKQTRPIVDDELLRAVETEAATAVAHHWRVSVSTVVRWRRAAGLRDTRRSVPGTAALYVANSGKLRDAEAMTARRIATRAWTPEEDAALDGPPAHAAEKLPHRPGRAIPVRRSRVGKSGPIGRPRKRASEG